ncbi:hypothetical protein X765_32395 [Mesorhizobium sp. LSHC440B00]|nr:hypothetical protein X765_32395 [Mesorhizobium sp. LSHC440B00]ESX29994.1 hypothetical protein X763_30015 [Mesorhizobium sp. LSHC432A00]ESX31241.1 hypothetical protein X764_30595 [Mesorhizobium sp. LSHC440A00]
MEIGTICLEGKTNLIVEKEPCNVCVDNRLGSWSDRLDNEIGIKLEFLVPAYSA